LMHGRMISLQVAGSIPCASPRDQGSIEDQLNTPPTGFRLARGRSPSSTYRVTDIGPQPAGFGLAGARPSRASAFCRQKRSSQARRKTPRRHRGGLSTRRPPPPRRTTPAALTRNFGPAADEAR
jgi:hypothetical protein